MPERGIGETEMKIEPLMIGNLTAHVPVMQGGMGVGISLSGLAGAVAAEGGIGIISTAIGMWALTKTRLAVISGRLKRK